MKAKLLRLHPQDNIVVATAPIEAHSVLKLDRVKIEIVSNVPMAGKVATRPIAEGEKIIKFGQSIGHATRNIEPGEWVHTHNLASDYLPTPERDSSASQESHATSPRGDELDPSQRGSLLRQSDSSGQCESNLQEATEAPVEASSPEIGPAGQESPAEGLDSLPGNTLQDPSQAGEDLSPNDKPETQSQD